MNKTEKQVIKNMYTEKLESLKLFKGSDHETVLEIELRTIEILAKSLFTHEEVIEMKNAANIKVYHNNSNYLSELVKSAFNWMRQIEKEQGEKQYPFVVSGKGIKNLHSHYDWLDIEQYKGFFVNINLMNDYLNKAS
ncbi:hypothetical protein M3649_03980 [Ureibacillus chungkukjangi]|uniref:hypothetical protein n=1 Tax=Ureibacillus chungkukjangi TaxID=1202712 RepID=UPI00203DA8C2|nr:hypothetical protein [Ureibacillus chungkukjangi]MCM3387291.1 hypothetical protein [Ureibacillus chungkukjangi]